MKIQIRHHPMHLRRAVAGFRMAQGLEDIELFVEGEEVRTISPQAPLAGRDIGLQSEVELSMRVRREIAPGVYTLDAIVVETYGGQEFSYEAAHEEGLGELGFEVVQEPDEKPALSVTILPRSEGI
jgi:hypothetical protein